MRPAEQEVVFTPGAHPMRAAASALQAALPVGSDAITCPAEAVGLDIEPGLAELLLADLRAAPASAVNGSLAVDDGAGS